MGFMAPKVPKPLPPPPPPPSAPDYSAAMAARRQNVGQRSALGGTFLTAGMSLGGAKRGKSYLGV